ncbi:MAG: hypothetical protein AABX69_02050 [Nanoarchaeota archaeon]
MSPLQFASVAVVSYLGLFAGFFLASLTKEELPTGRRYFPWLQRLIILAVVAVTMNFFGFGLVIKFFTYAILLLLLTLKINLQLAYTVFGVFLFAVSSSSNTLLMVASLVFVFGLLSGSNYFAGSVRKKSDMVGEAKSLLVKNSIYVVVALTLFLLFGKIGLVRLMLQLR